MPKFDVNWVIEQAQRRGWSYVYKPAQGQLVFLERHLHGDKCMLHIWCTTGTVGSYLDHPTQGKTQLYRRNMDEDELKRVMDNPRVHTGEGYHRAPAR